MLQNISIPNTKNPPKHWQVLTLCWLFAILYGVWLLPHTVFVRNVCLGGGALLSLPIIAANWRLFFQRAAAPIWLIALLLIWVTIHLFFIGQDFNRQYLEYVTIWKRVAIGCLFALGLGLGIGQTINQRESKTYWAIIYFGLLLPTVIYFFKFSLGLVAPKYGIELSHYLLLNPDHMNDSYGIARTVYVFFCLPAMAVGLGCIAYELRSSEFRWRKVWIYLLSVPLTLGVFANEGDRLGSAYGFLALGIFIFISIVKSTKRKNFYVPLIIVCTLLVTSTLIAKKMTYQNPAWQTLWVDAKVAVQVDRYDGWRTRIMPLNELGTPVNASNYERISWATAGGRLLLHNPFGYGLLSLSFGGLGKQVWPNADISWTHSAWLDFALGYGFPGLLLIWSALFLAWRRSKGLQRPWRALGRWGLFIAAAVMFTKEISTEVVVNAMIFMVILVSAINLSAARHFVSPQSLSD